jgi:hypothetical protein
MKRLAKISRSQLALPLEGITLYLHPTGQMREELISALADLLREALGTEAIETTRDQGGNDEREDHI